MAFSALDWHDHNAFGEWLSGAESPLQSDPESDSILQAVFLNISIL